MNALGMSEFVADKIGLNWDNPKCAYQCRVLLAPEESGGFSAIALDLPGVASQGDTASEAIANFREAFAAVIAEYNASNMPIPWTQDDVQSDAPREAKILWISVDV